MRKESFFPLLGVCIIAVLFLSSCIKEITNQNSAVIKLKVAEIEMTLQVIDVETTGIRAAPTAKAKKRLASITGIKVAETITLDQDLGGSPFGDVSKDAIKQLVDQIDPTISTNEWTLPEKARVAVKSFENKSQLRASVDVGEGSADLLVAELVNRGKWTVLYRESLDDILREHGMSSAEDLIDPETPVESRLKVAQYLIKGSIIDAEVRDGIW